MPCVICLNKKLKLKKMKIILETIKKKKKNWRREPPLWANGGGQPPHGWSGGGRAAPLPKGGGFSHHLRLVRGWPNHGVLSTTPYGRSRGDRNHPRPKGGGHPPTRVLGGGLATPKPALGVVLANPTSSKEWLLLLLLLRLFFFNCFLIFYFS